MTLAEGICEPVAPQEAAGAVGGIGWQYKASQLRRPKLTEFPHHHRKDGEYRETREAFQRQGDKDYTTRACIIHAGCVPKHALWHERRWGRGREEHRYRARAA